MSFDNFINEMAFLAIVRRPYKGKTEEEIFDSFFNQHEIQELFSQTTLTGCKSKLTSESARNEGNTFFRRKANMEALKQYNWSILTAPHPKLDSRLPFTSSHQRASAILKETVEETNMNSDDKTTMNSDEQGIQENTCEAHKGKEKEGNKVQEGTEGEKVSDVNDEEGRTLHKEVEALRREVSSLRDEVAVLQGKVAFCCKEVSKKGRTESENWFARSGEAMQVTQETMLDKEDDEKDHLDYQELALAYANRSAVLVELKQYEDCLRDIEMALKHGYPKKSKEKLLKRKDKCLRALEKGEFQEKLVKEYCSDDEVTLLNKHIVGASDAVNINFTSEKGRHLVASKDVHPGEVLIDHPVMVEYDSSSDMLRFCYTCNSLCIAPLPCPGCVVVIFCKESCREKGLAERHEKECFDISPRRADTEVWYLYRLMVQTTFASLKDEVPRLRREAERQAPDRLGFNDNGVYDPSEYRTFYHLETHLQEEAANLPQSCTKALSVLYLLLRSNKFFIDEAGEAFEPKSEDLVFVGGVALHHFLAFQKNAKKAVMNPLNVGEFHVSPLGALLNHSCYPSAMLTLYAGRMRITALRSIKTGEEATLAYGGILFNHIPKAMRQTELLQQYSFFCRCMACEGNWTEILGIGMETFKCPSCGGPVSSSLKECMTCKLDFLRGDGENVYNLAEAERLIRQATLTFLRISPTVEDRNRLKENILALSSVIESFDKYIYPPDEVHIKAQEALGFCLREKSRVIALRKDVSHNEGHLGFEEWLPF